TDRRSHIELLEPDAFLRQPVDVRRRDFLVAETSKVLPSHVIDQNHAEVGTFRGRHRMEQALCQQQEKPTRKTTADGSFHLDPTLSNRVLRATCKCVSPL